MITVSYDESDGVIRTVTYGQTSREEIEDYLHRLLAIQERARAEWGRVLHLVDASQLNFQSDENLSSLAGASIDMQITDQNLTAVVMKSPEAVAQMERMPSQLDTRIFGDFKSAKEWLFARQGKLASLAA